MTFQWFQANMSFMAIVHDSNDCTKCTTIHIVLIRDGTPIHQYIPPASFWKHHIYIYIYTHAYTHAYTHTYTYIYDKVVYYIYIYIYISHIVFLMISGKDPIQKNVTTRDVRICREGDRQAITCWIFSAIGENGDQVELVIPVIGVEHIKGLVKHAIYMYI